LRRESRRVVTGTAFRIYLILVTSNRPLGVRELQELVKLKSPSTVKYHLDRLRSHGLVRQLPDGRYEAVRSNDPVLSIYFFLRNSPIPKLIPVSISFAVFIAVYMLLQGGVDWVILAVALVFTAYVVYEGFKVRNIIKWLAG